MSASLDSVEFVGDEVVGDVARAALLAALMGAFAYVSFPYPFSPVPVTLQVLGVFLAGILLGPVWGAIAMVFYLVAGVMGAPVFSFGQAGPGVLFSERIGYLLAFPIAAFLVGMLAHGGAKVRAPQEISVARLLSAMVAGVCVIYALGITGMMIVLALEPWEAIVLGGIAFLPAEAAKIVAAVGIVHSDRLAAAGV